MHRTLLAITLSLWSLTTMAQPQVVASILPIHSLVAGVMQDITEPELLLRGGSSPHDYRLRPSDVRTLNQADVVFWVGAELETVLARPLAQAPAQAVALMDTPGMELLPLREGGLWEAHDHGHGHGHDHHHHHHGDEDAHIWLEPGRAALMVEHIATVLSEHDPTHAEQYQHNAASVIARLHALEDEIVATLASVRTIPYIVFHDAYQYFEDRFGTLAVGSITLNPERRPGARRIIDIRQRIAERGASCVFSEPQFEPTLVTTLIEGTEARSGVLDPLGATLTPGPDAYFHLLNGLAEALRECLEPRV